MAGHYGYSDGVRQQHPYNLNIGGVEGANAELLYGPPASGPSFPTHSSMHNNVSIVLACMNVVNQDIS